MRRSVSKLPARCDMITRSVISSSMRELGRRDVEREPWRARQRALPRADLRQGAVERPFAYAADEAALLRQRDEFLGHQQAALGMAPAHQRLGTDHLAAAAYPMAFDYRVPVEDQLAAGKRAAQLVLQAQALRRALV